MLERLVRSFQVSERRACRVLCVPRATYRYRSCLDPRTELQMRIREIAQARVRYGYRKIRVLLNREGWDVGKYLVCRLYEDEAGRQAQSCTTTLGAVQARRAKPGLEYGFRRRSTAGRYSVPITDHRRCLHARGGSHRGWLAPKRRRCRAHAEQVEARPRSTEGAVL